MELKEAVSEINFRLESRDVDVWHLIEVYAAMAEDQGTQVKEQQPEQLNGQPESTEQNYQTLKILAKTGWYSYPG